MDFFQRVKVMDPPLKVRTLGDVFAVHGARNDTTYRSGTGSGFVADDPTLLAEQKRTNFTMQRSSVNCNYFLRKWGCATEVDLNPWQAYFAGCKFPTPFNRSVPVWYWHHSKSLRDRDKGLSMRLERAGASSNITWWLFDTQTNTKILKVPKHYGEWSGYVDQDQGGVCRLSGYLGWVGKADEGTLCL